MNFRNPAKCSLWILALLGSLVRGHAADGGPARPPIELPVVHPARGEIHRYVTLPGTLRPRQWVTLHARITGHLKSIAVDLGDAVTAGQVLAEIEVPELEADRVRHRVEVKVAEAELRRLESARTKSPDLVTPQSVEETSGRLEIARANLERVETLLRYGHVLAPFAGVVTMRHVDVGALVPVPTGGGAGTGTAIVTLMDFATVRARVPVPESEASRVQPGQPARVSVEGLPGRVFEGVVSRHGYALEEAGRTLPVEVDLPNPKLELRPGMYASVRVGVERHGDALLVPVGALVIEKNSSFVFVAAAGTARKTPVKTGFNDGARVEVISGLTGTESVVLVGKTILADGAAIVAKEAK